MTRLVDAHDLMNMDHHRKSEIDRSRDETAGATKTERTRLL